MDLPMLKQLFVASSPQLAALSVGGVSGFSNVILEQLKANDSSIQINFDEATWIGSTHGLAGLPSIAMPTIMQLRGRKFTYIISCLLIITGWVLTYFSQNITTIIIGECFHGLGNNSVVIVSFATISEMVDPRYRIISLTFFIINQTLGVSVTGIIGRYLHWKTVSIIMCIPVVIALMMSYVWPESPSWLAYKGEYAKCEEAFLWLRGSNDSSQKELKELLSGQREHFTANRKHKFTLKDVWLQIISRDFYVPCFHTLVTLCPFYMSGMLVILVYGVEIMRTVSNSLSAARYGMIAAHVSAYVAALITALLLKLFKNKTVFISSGISSAIMMLGASVVTLLQYIGVLSSDSTICVYFLVAFMGFISLGVSTLSFSISGELMPVKHRGLGGAMYMVLTGVLHSLVLKFSPYLMLYTGLWGIFLLFSTTELFCMLYIWRYVPETKGRTLQQIEDFYNHGQFITRNNEGMECIGKSL